jgi:beta-lactamase class A
MKPFTIIIIILLLLTALAAFSQKTDKQLQRHLMQMIEGFHGDIGFYVQNLKNGKVAAFNADTVFPTASIVKVPILVGVMHKIEMGELKYHQKLVYKDSLLYAGKDILGSFKNGETIELSKVMMLMLTISDNTASLWLQSLAGTGTRINELMDSLGLPDTRVNSRTPGREEAQRRYQWGQTTPRQMATLFKLIGEGKVISLQASANMLQRLGRNYWDEEALSTIPPGVFVASKNGAVDASRSEVMWVNAKKTPYLFAVFTKNNTDKSWTPNNEAWTLTRNLSQFVWKYFNN